MKYFAYNHLQFLSPQQDEFYPHIHNDYEILFFESGDADYLIGGSIYHLQENDLLLIKPAVLHGLILNSHKTYERTLFNFTESEILKDAIPQNEIYHISEDSLIKFLVNDLKKAKELFSKTEFNYYKKVSLELILLYLKYDQSEKKLPARTFNTTLDKILQYIDENIETPITADILSKTFFVSTSWIVHTFQKKLNTSVKKYINEKKILHAQTLIRRGCSAMKAAELCSFINYSTFFRLYKQFLGNEPSADSPKNL